MVEQNKCSFCEKDAKDVKHLVAGPLGSICDKCIVLCQSEIDTINKNKKYRYSFELLFDFFGKNVLDEYVTVGLEFSLNLRSDLQIALEHLLGDFTVDKVTGLSQKGGYDNNDFTHLLENGNRATALGPLQYEDVDIGEDSPKKCLKNGLWLLSKQTQKLALLLTINNDYMGKSLINVEIISPQGKKGNKLSSDITEFIKNTLEESRSYRGKILSLDIANYYQGGSKGINVHKLEKVSKKEIILSKETIELIDRNIVSFVKQRAQLRSLGMSLKKGVMFYGPPGTGKTHTVHYLADKLSDHTIFLVTAEQIGNIGEYINLARLLQPSIIVIEDADLIARSRETMHSLGEESLLNKLLNEMDGLRKDSELMFILTTNRPESLEAAIASRPGRIDQSIEFPLPDLGCRKKLIRLYGRGLKLNTPLVSDIAKRIEGMSAAFVKELMRRTAQFYIESEASTVKIEHVHLALEELLITGGKLNAKYLKGSNYLIKA